MSTAAPARRHALNLPAGSVRAIHILVMTFILCVILWIPSKTVQPLPPFLVYLMFLVVGHFFAAHGVTIGPTGDEETRHHPLYLPGGFVRLIVIAALAGSFGYQYYLNPDLLRQHFELSLEEMKKQPLVPVLILGGFFLGVLIRTLLGRDRSAWVQDVEAWISLMALLGLLVTALVHLVIAPSLETPVSYEDLGAVVGTVVAFYFGERS